MASISAIIRYYKAAILTSRLWLQSRRQRSPPRLLDATPPPPPFPPTWWREVRLCSPRLRTTSLRRSFTVLYIKPYIYNYSFKFRTHLCLYTHRWFPGRLQKMTTMDGIIIVTVSLRKEMVSVARRQTMENLFHRVWLQ